MLKELSDRPKGAELTKWQCGLPAGMQIGAASVENSVEFPKKTKKVETAIPLLGIYSKKPKTLISKNISTPRFTAA